MYTLLIATHNQGKLREYEGLLADLPVTVTSLQEMKIDYDVEETGSTFAENAILKARAYATISGHWTWADDSGLEVDALQGRPGVYSARYAGPGATDQDRYEKLIRELKPFPESERSARFRCVVALVAPDGQIHTVDGSVEGRIITAPRGTHGFGYDPIFFMPERGATMAELPPQEKNLISHRGRAAAKAKRLLASLLSAK